VGDIAAAFFDPDEPVGVVLARMRRAAGLTGRELGERVGLSQPTISRIERGKGGPPDPQDVLRLATALGVDKAAARLLMERAERSHDRMTDWRPASAGLPSRGQDLRRWESGIETFRIFQPAVIVGLLQTSQYARAVLSASLPYIASDGAGPAATSVPEAVSARVQRQEVLADRGRKFRFVMMETVFGNRVCRPEEMLAQIRRVREVAAQENVVISVVPAEAVLGVAPFHGFELLDDRMVLVDLFNTAITSHGRVDIGIYRRVFDEFEAEAVDDIDSILDKYQRIYAQLSLPQPTS
jgi:transcriptional regulator with XRE-family HTH domain